MSYIAVLFSGFAGKAVEHGCPPLPQTGRFSHCSRSTGQRTHTVYTDTQSAVKGIKNVYTYDCTYNSYGIRIIAFELIFDKICY